MKFLLVPMLMLVFMSTVGCTNAVESSQRPRQKNVDSNEKAMGYLFKSAWRDYVLKMKEGSKEEQEIARKSLLDVPDAKQRMAEIVSDPNAKPDEKALAEELLKSESDEE